MLGVSFVSVLLLVLCAIRTNRIHYFALNLFQLLTSTRFDRGSTVVKALRYK